MTLLRFESCKLHLKARQLVVGDRSVDLQPLVFDLLAYLAQNPRRVIPKDELLAAVWRSPQVSESVVARAVMKGRRAIQDSAASPRWLHTLHGRGYRLDVDVSVEEEPAPSAHWTPDPSSLPGALGVLPCRNRTGDSSLDWTCLGLAGLIHHLLDAANGMKPAPMAATTALCRTLDQEGDVLRATCQALGVREALACELTRDEQSWKLTSWRGSSMPTATKSSVFATDIVQLATRLTEVLRGHQLPPDSLPQDPFWREQLAQSIGLYEAGSPRQALELLGTCEPHFRPNARITLLKCNMLYRIGQAEASARAAQEALELARGEDSLVAGIRAHYALAYALHDLGRMDEAVEHAEAALQMTEQSPQVFVLRPWVLCGLSRTKMQQGHLQAALKLVEEAVALSSALGQFDDEAQALVWAAFLLERMGHASKATVAIERAAQLAQRGGNPDRQANVVRTQAIILQWQQRPAAALDACRRSIALWTRSGNQVGRNWATVHVLELMAEAGEGDAFEAEYLRFKEQPGLSLAMLDTARCAHAVWLWKQGQQHPAVEALSALSREVDPTALLLRGAVGEELVFMLAQLRETQRAQDELARLPEADRPIRRARCRAAVDLAAGDAASATRRLRVIWESTEGYGLGAVELLTDLAWLLLEQWSPGDSMDELESLHTLALDHPHDHMPSALFRAGWRLRSAPDAEHAADWEATMQRAASRLRHCAWITQPSYRDRLANGRPRCLDVLLTRAFI